VDRHFNSCKEIPEDTKKSSKSLRGFAAKAERETQQYWINSARELPQIDTVKNGEMRFFHDLRLPSLTDLIAN